MLPIPSLRARRVANAAIRAAGYTLTTRPSTDRRPGVVSSIGGCVVAALPTFGSRWSTREIDEVSATECARLAEILVAAGLTVYAPLTVSLGCGPLTVIYASDALRFAD